MQNRIDHLVAGVAGIAGDTGIPVAVSSKPADASVAIDEIVRRVLAQLKG
jgi:hypothetical protein